MQHQQNDSIKNKKARQEKKQKYFSFFSCGI